MAAQDVVSRSACGALFLRLLPLGAQIAAKIASFGRHLLVDRVLPPLSPAMIDFEV